MIIAVGNNSDGYTEILSMMPGDTESESSWSEFISKLKDKDLHGVDVTNSYDHKGLIRAIMQYSCGVTRQGCQSKL